MLRIMLAVVVLASGGLSSWAWWPKKAHPATARAAAFADNYAEGAEYRWRTSQSRHWRYIVTAR
jgi:predicted negative regulator of RcsB-dependent stress response